MIEASQRVVASALVPPDEEGRLAAIRRYDILDTPPDGAFDRIAMLAAEFFNVPIGTVSIVDHDRIWFKARHGLEVAQVGRDPGLCASAFLQDGPTPSQTPWWTPVPSPTHWWPGNSG